ncbi:MAG: hypothetical protein A3J38_08875 [Gammaproteobacteria bacterium RIFCSPHIGHO2_12_FULL_45_9]|nr:MAG: hypothetical protein A3J38_08875 [Gammaproteobacteria bacterium RIFCSPHIGHO2_12_FULL_45_9]
MQNPLLDSKAPQVTNWCARGCTRVTACVASFFRVPSPVVAVEVESSVNATPPYFQPVEDSPGRSATTSYGSIEKSDELHRSVSAPLMRRDSATATPPIVIRRLYSEGEVDPKAYGFEDDYRWLNARAGQPKDAWSVEEVATPSGKGDVEKVQKTPRPIVQGGFLHDFDAPQLDDLHESDAEEMTQLI